MGQLPKLFGFKVSAEGLIGQITGFVHGLAKGEAVGAAAAVGIAGILPILVLQRWLPKLPAVLIMVVASIAAASVFSLASRGVSLVGVLPKGFPPLTIPHVRLADLGPLFAGALGIARRLGQQAAEPSGGSCRPAPLRGTPSGMGMAAVWLGLQPTVVGQQPGRRTQHAAVAQGNGTVLI